MEQKAGLEPYVPISARFSKATIVVFSLGIWIVGVLRVLWIGFMGRDTVLDNMGKLDLDSDLTVPSWYSSMLMVICALLFFLIAMAVRTRGSRDARLWAVLGVGFILLSMDEAVAIHEMVSARISSAVDMPAIFTFSWIPIAIVLVGVLAVAFIPFLLRLPRQLAVRMLIAAAIYVVGIIGMGMVNGALFSAIGQQKTFFFSLMSSVEEGLEILGLTFLAMTLIDHLATSRPPLMFRFAPEQA